jgi:hypothetical protein
VMSALARVDQESASQLQNLLVLAHNIR